MTQMTLWERVLIKGMAVQVGQKLYGASHNSYAFRTPGLIRFISAEDAYLSPTNGGPRMYINLEDHLSYNTGKLNKEFLVRAFWYAWGFVFLLNMHLKHCLILFWPSWSLCSRMQLLWRCQRLSGCLQTCTATREVLILTPKCNHYWPDWDEVSANHGAFPRWM